MRASLGLPRELWIENFGKSWSRVLERKGPCLYVCIDGSRRACGVGACACIVQTLSELRETSGPRIDRISPAHPPWRRRQFRELKKIIFSAPRKCPIDLFGPRANRTILKRLHVAFRSAASLVSFTAMPSCCAIELTAAIAVQIALRQRRGPMRAPLWTLRSLIASVSTL